MPFYDKNSGVQADYIPEGSEVDASPAVDMVDVPVSTSDSAVRLAEQRSIALTYSDVKGPEAIDPGDKSAPLPADTEVVTEDVVAATGPEPATGVPEPSDNESEEAASDAGDLPRTDEDVVMDFVPEDEAPAKGGKATKRASSRKKKPEPRKADALDAGVAEERSIDRVRPGEDS
jgi:hypothetical protein